MDDWTAIEETDRGSTALGWLVTTTRGSATQLHERAIPEQVVPAVWVHHLDRAALVLGSGQNPQILNTATTIRDGIEVCRRRSGGGLVALRPADHVWIDLLLPRSSVLWDDDVHRGFHWLGEVWLRTIERLGRPANPEHQPELRVHRSTARHRDQGRVVCFAGLGSGEVTVDGNKVVGLSQRRVRAGARFQCAFVPRWDPDFHAQHLRPEVLGSVGLDLATVAAGLPTGYGTPPDPQAVITEFLRQLPSP